MGAEKLDISSKSVEENNDEQHQIDAIDLDRDERDIATSGVADDEQLEEDLFIGSIGSKDATSTNMWHKDFIINNVKACFKLDTGSEANLIPERTIARMNNIRIIPRKCWLVTFIGEKIEPLGETTLQINGQRLTFQVSPSSEKTHV